VGPAEVNASAIAADCHARDHWALSGRVRLVSSPTDPDLGAAAWL